MQGFLMIEEMLMAYNVVIKLKGLSIIHMCLHYFKTVFDYNVYT
jgi:hypothetical protein